MKTDIIQIDNQGNGFADGSVFYSSGPPLEVVALTLLKREARKDGRPIAGFQPLFIADRPGCGWFRRRGPNVPFFHGRLSFPPVLWYK